MTPGVFTIPEVAAYLRVGPKVVRRLCKLKRIRHQVPDRKGTVRIVYIVEAEGRQPPPRPAYRVESYSSPPSTATRFFCCATHTDTAPEALPSGSDAVKWM